MNAEIASSFTRSCWRRRPWLTAIVLALALLLPYISATGPVVYAENRGLVPANTYFVCFRPLYLVLHAIDGPSEPINRWLSAYVLWWVDLGVKHRGA